MTIPVIANFLYFLVCEPLLMEVLVQRRLLLQRAQTLRIREEEKEDTDKRPQCTTETVPAKQQAVVSAHQELNHHKTLRSRM